ncbi:hypothetical protein HS125_13805 [bacterium]|nr:hypothetical protein [bacterium]
MNRSLERVAYATFCGGLAFFLAAGLFAALQWLLHMDVFALSSLTLLYFFSLLAALAGGVAVGAAGYASYGDSRRARPARPLVVALFSGPLASLLIRLLFQTMERTAVVPHLRYKPETLGQYWDWLVRMSAHQPPPHGRAWWMALVLSATFILLLYAQRYLIRRTCTRPREETTR